MSNELLFFSHILIVLGLILWSLRLGKEAATAFFALQIVLANLFVVKQVTLFGLTLTCTEMFTIGAFLTMNLIQEYWGEGAAKKAIWISFFTLLFFGVMAKMHLLYKPSPHDAFHEAYSSILKHSPRILFASLFVTFSVQRLDLKLYQFLQQRLSERSLIIRCSGSLIISQLIDTVLFSFVGLYGIVNNIWHIMIASYLIKLVVVFCMAPFATFSKRVVHV